MQVAIAEPGNLDQAHQVVRQASGVLRNDGLVVFPTETVYGVGACANSDEAVDRLTRLGGLGADPVFAIHLPDAAMAGQYIDLTASASLQRLVDRVFPGPVTLAIECTAAQVDKVLRGLALPDSTAQRLFRDGLVVLRCPDHPLTQSMLGQVRQPVIGGAAHLAGQSPAYDAATAMQNIGSRVDLVVDGGRCRYAKASTLVRVSGTRIDVERTGVYDERFIRKLMRYTILFICSGNTCRSPMAEAIARQMLAEQRGVGADQLEGEGVRVGSAGIFAMGCAPAADHAIEALQKQGIDLADHRARQLTAEMIGDADVVYCMTESHRGAVLDLAPMAGNKVHRLDASGDVDDPIGSDATTYQRTAEMIRRRLTTRFAELKP